MWILNLLYTVPHSLCPFNPCKQDYLRDLKDPESAIFSEGASLDKAMAGANAWGHSSGVLQVQHRL